MIKQVVISAKQGKTFPPVSVEVLGSNCRSSSSLFIGTVFAYGQTFSGKTHTMAGSGPETIYKRAMSDDETRYAILPMTTYAQTSRKRGGEPEDHNVSGDRTHSKVSVISEEGEKGL